MFEKLILLLTGVNSLVMHETRVGTVTDRGNPSGKSNDHIYYLLLISKLIFLHLAVAWTVAITDHIV